MRRSFLLLAALNFAVVAWAIYDETWTRRPWKSVQGEFNRLLVARGEPEVAVGIREVTNPALGLHDRCHTCHLGIAQEGFGDELPLHLRTHPRKEELLGAHPPERFGCTPCHGGQGPQTKGISRARFDHGRDDPYWERPLLQGPFVQSSCLDCHAFAPRGAQVLARGQRLFEALQCGGCHLAAHAEPVRRPPAPPLDQLKEKTSQAFVLQWLQDPRAVRPGTRMPAFWEGGDLEPRAIVAYLAAAAPGALPDLGQAAVHGDLSQPQLIEEGRVLFDQVGCRGCHLLSLAERETFPDAPEQAHFGPSLEAVGEKATALWLAAWLTDPRAVWPEAKMPDPRLSAAQLTPLVAFLSSLRREGRPAAQALWEPPDPKLVEVGRQAIVRLGCTGCHLVPGVAAEGRPGPDLDALGDRPPEELTFGDHRPDCQGRSKLECFALEKVLSPRRLGGTGVSAPLMPDFGLQREDAEALAVFLLSQRDRGVPEGYRRALDPQERALAEGERLFARHNCAGCHRHQVGEDAGGWIRRFYAEEALAPPPLTAAGQKLQTPWLWEYLRKPRTIRPFLAPKMPDYHLEDAAVDVLARWFAVRDGEPYPIQRLTVPLLAAEDRGQAQRLFGELQCLQCHPSAGVAQVEGRSQAELAPDLALAPGRLKQGWVRAFLLDPQRLQPNTRMPTFFIPLDEDNPDELDAVPGYFGDDAALQIDALSGWVLTPPAPAGR